MGQNVEINWTSNIKAPLTSSNSDSIEFRLDQLGSNYLFVDLADTDLILPITKYNWGGEFQLTETTITPFVKGIPADHYKAVFFLKHSYPMNYVDVER